MFSMPRGRHDDVGERSGELSGNEKAIEGTKGSRVPTFTSVRREAKCLRHDLRDHDRERGARCPVGSKAFRLIWAMVCGAGVSDPRTKSFFHLTAGLCRSSAS